MLYNFGRGKSAELQYRMSRHGSRYEWKSNLAGWPSMSRLGFGCAAVGGRVSRRDSLAAMETAFDSGLNFFDTARSYGFGQSEEIVGDFLQGRRSSVVLCTKFGILPSKQSGWKQRLRPAARTAIRLFPGLRQSAQKKIGDQFLPGQFSVATLHSSLEESLRELKTEYVDLLVMHGAPSSVLQQDDLLDALGRLAESGKIRMAGISGDLATISQTFNQRPRAIQSAQFTLNMSNMEFAESTRRNADLLLVGNQPFGGTGGAEALRETINTLRTSHDLSRELREKLDPADPQLLPELVLNCVLQGTGVTATIAAMFQKRHILSNVQAIRDCRFTVEDLSVLRAQITSSRKRSETNQHTALQD